MIILELFLVFLKIGAVSFGGGYGMIALLQEEVIKHGWFSETEFLNFIAVCESTPGPIAVNMATFIGSSCAGFVGSLVSTIGVVLPAFIIMLIIALCLKNLMQYPIIERILNTIQPIVTGLIIVTVIFLFTKTILNFKTISDIQNNTCSFNYMSFIILLILFLIGIIYKKIKKKNISPIILILISACFGIIFGILNI